MKCRGENHGMAKLTEREAKAILRLRHAGVGYHLLAEAFQISIRTVGSICRGERWLHLDSEMEDYNGTNGKTDTKASKVC